jgi:centromere protein C
LAFAQSSIVTRDVAGSEFKYAKIMTLPFFGSGIVELPPEGFKRAKNSSKMQMCFFVHEGKVMVEVGPATDGETNTFAISRGGVWVVPRGKISPFPFSIALPIRCVRVGNLALARRSAKRARNEAVDAVLPNGGDTPLQHTHHAVPRLQRPLAARIRPDGEVSRAVCVCDQPCK